MTVIDLLLPEPRHRLSALWQTRRAQMLWWLWFGGIVVLTVALGIAGARPDSTTLPWLIFYVGLALALYQPRYGVYLILFFALAGDGLLLYQYPFVKNFSSPESILYVSDALVISPVEVYMVVTLLSWFGRIIFRRRIPFYRSPLLGPMALFIAFVTYGMVWGLSRGGNLTIALWEARPIFYLFVMLLLVSNVMTERDHFVNLMWFALAAIAVEGVIGTRYFISVLNWNLRTVDRITEHSAAIHMNTLFVFLLTAFLYRVSNSKRLLLLAMTPCVAITFLVTQRRAGFVSLAVALVLIAVFLYKEHRDLFWTLAPPAAFLGLVYLVIFWNSGSAIALPAQAIKSVVAASRANSIDRASNIYRQIENVNASVTIHVFPLTGVGFGNKFIIRVPMPDISHFGWWEYITHNSIVWMWMQTGVFGFMAMMYLIGSAIMTGVRAAWRLPGGEISAVGLTAVLYIVMHFIYAYVDMSWDNQSMIYLGAMMGVAGTIEHVVAQPVRVRPKRWPWQPDPPPVPGLRDS